MLRSCMYDFVVVGAGPAGSRFARSASERGRDVLVLESGEVGRPLACSGHVSRDVWGFVPDDARDRLLQNEVYGARFHLGGADSDDYAFYKDEPVSNVIDRVGLDRTLADCAREAGAEVRDGHTVTRPSNVSVPSGPRAVTATLPDSSSIRVTVWPSRTSAPASRAQSARVLSRPTRSMAFETGSSL